MNDKYKQMKTSGTTAVTEPSDISGDWFMEEAIETFTEFNQAEIKCLVHALVAGSGEEVAKEHWRDFLIWVAQIREANELLSEILEGHVAVAMGDDCPDCGGLTMDFRELD